MLDTKEYFPGPDVILVPDLTKKIQVPVLPSVYRYSISVSRIIFFFRVSASVLKKMVSEKRFRYMFWKIWSRYRKSGLEKKVLVLVSENLASDKKSRFQSGLWSRHTLCSTQIFSERTYAFPRSQFVKGIGPNPR